MISSFATFVKVMQPICCRLRRSSVPRARILNITLSGDLPWDEIVVVSAKEIPGNNYVALIAHVWLAHSLPKWAAKRIAATWSRPEREKFLR